MIARNCMSRLIFKEGVVMARLRVLAVALIAVGMLVLPLARGHAQPQITVVVAYGSDVPTLDVNTVTTYGVRTIHGNVSDPLVMLDKNMRPAPGLAVSWESLNPTTWRLRLRRGVKFHNGEPFDAAAAKYSIERATQSRSTVRTYLQDIKEVRIVDDFTVDLITTPNNPLIIPNLCCMYVLPPKYHQQVGEAFGQQPVGTGPFRFVEWRKGDRVIMATNRGYWGGAPKFDRLEVRFVPEATTRVAMLLKGEADLIVDVPPELAQAVASGANTKLLRFTGARRMHVMYDGRPGSSPPLDNLKVRQALVFAINREAIIKNVLLGTAKLYGGYGRKWSPGADQSLAPPRYNPEQAKKLLAEAGFPNGFETTLTGPSAGYPKGKEILEAIAEQLGQVGIRARIVVMEFGDYASRLITRQHKGLVFARRGADTGDPSDEFRFALWSKGIYPYFLDPRLDALYEETLSMVDSQKRFQIFKELDKHVVTQLVPEIPLFDIDDVYGLTKRLDWVPTNVKEPLDFRGIQDVR